MHVLAACASKAAIVPSPVAALTSQPTMPTKQPTNQPICLHLQGLRGDAALRLLSEPEHHRLRQVAKKDAEGRAAEDPGALL